MKILQKNPMPMTNSNHTLADMSKGDGGNSKADPAHPQKRLQHLNAAVCRGSAAPAGFQYRLKTERPLVDMCLLWFRGGKVLSQASLPHGIAPHSSACLLSVSFEDKPQM